MTENNNIDDLIREGMEGFSPTPPAGVWENVSGQLHHAAGSGVAAGAKQLGIWSKLAIAVTVPAALGGILYFALPAEKPVTVNEIQHSVPAITESVPSPSVQESVSSDSKAKNVEVKIKNKPVVKTASPKAALHEEGMAEPKHEVIGATVNSTNKDVVNPPKNQDPVIPASVVNNTNSEKKSTPETKTQKQNIVNLPDTKTEPQHMHNAPEYGNVFSPNGDGQNDVWEIRVEPLIYFHLKIADRNGKLVFETDQPGNFWNGADIRSGQECEVGQYSYFFEYQYDKSDPVRTKTGILTLIR